MLTSLYASGLSSASAPEILHGCGLEAKPDTTIVGLVAAGAGVSLVPASVTKVRGTEVVYRPLKGESPPARIGTAWGKGNSSHTVEALLELVEEFGRA